MIWFFWFFECTDCKAELQDDATMLNHCIFEQHLSAASTLDIMGISVPDILDTGNCEEDVTFLFH